MTAEQMRALAERVMASDGNYDRSLWHEVEVATGNENGPLTSLDAAMSLVPASYVFSGAAEFAIGWGVTLVPRVWPASAVDFETADPFVARSEKCKSFALALTAAALIARAAELDAGQ